MRYICRLTGKKLVFKTKEAYEAHLRQLEAKGIVKRERSRKKRPHVARDDEWRRKRQPLVSPAQRFKRPAVEVPPGFEPWTFSVVHPSRGRPASCRQCIYRWWDLFSCHNRLDYILSLDSDDCKPYLPVLVELSGLLVLRAAIDENKTVVQALNRGAALARGDVLVYVSDDFECPPNWDLVIREAAGRPPNQPWLLHVHDGIQDRIATITIMSRGMYSRLGFMYHPSYESMFADNDITETAKAMGAYVSRTDITFKHNHHTVGGLPLDDTYLKENSPQAWKKGEAAFIERRSRGFDI